MKSFLLAVTDELLEVVNAARGERSRNAAIEDWLWSHPRVRATAKRLGIERQPRPERGKYQRSARGNLGRQSRAE